jgi:hypothetical protein
MLKKQVEIYGLEGDNMKCKIFHFDDMYDLIQNSINDWLEKQKWSFRVRHITQSSTKNVTIITIWYDEN